MDYRDNRNTSPKGSLLHADPGSRFNAYLHCGPLVPEEKYVGPIWKPSVAAAGSLLAGDIGLTDYEYRSSPEDFPTPIGAKMPVDVDASFRNRDQFSQIQPVIANVLVPAGAVAVMDLSPLAAAGARLHLTPLQSNVSTLLLDRDAGSQLIADAAAGRSATLVLNAQEEENATAFELAAVLPGRNYGTGKDQAIMLATHLDGPSVVEEDGPYAILSIFHYFTQIPQKDRPRTIVAFFDTRHFIPGTERAYPFDLVHTRPDLFENVVGGVSVEHWGESQFAEAGDDYRATGKPATTYIWGWPNQAAIDVAVKAIKDQNVPRTVVLAPARPGIHCAPQQRWMGAGFSAHLMKLGGWPGWHISGDWPSSAFQAYYPAYDSRVMPELFCKQSALAVQLVSKLMTGDVIAMAPDWGFLRAAVQTADDAVFLHERSRKALLDSFDALFACVEAGDYEKTKVMLGQYARQVDSEMLPKGTARIHLLIGKTQAWTFKALTWKKEGLLRPDH